MIQPEPDVTFDQSGGWPGLGSDLSQRASDSGAPFWRDFRQGGDFIVYPDQRPALTRRGLEQGTRVAVCLARPPAYPHPVAKSGDEDGAPAAPIEIESVAHPPW